MGVCVRACDYMFYMYILIFILTNNCVCFWILTLYSEW